MSENSILVKRGVRVVGTATERRAEELLAEVRDLFAQYQREVPKKRKPWPESIRIRVMELWGLGVGNHQISLAAEVPVQTLYSWRQRIKRGRDPGFAQIALVRSSRRSGFQIRQDEERRKDGLQLSQLDLASEAKPTTVTVSIILTNGIRVEGLDAVSAAEFLRRLS